MPLETASPALKALLGILFFGVLFGMVVGFNELFGKRRRRP